ncbi:hypothetical protein [Amycolatopsis sp. NPDC051102]|uniref:hypothetical protein n=1 Tax=Amycolatopsis sp. NPDC051102 TaxID=3155163 RepID=UPI00341286C4
MIKQLGFGATAPVAGPAAFGGSASATDIVVDIVNVLGMQVPVHEVAGASPENCAGNGASAGGTAQGG